MILHVNTAKPYDILIGKGLIQRAGELCREVSRAARVLIVSDSHVAPLYADEVAASLSAAGFIPAFFTFPAGEQSKRLSTVAAIYTVLAEYGFTRSDLIVALGGGVTGDMAGYAAATWLRGMDFVQIPTSVLAQVDSSIGGKTGVDIPEGKNLVGAFWQPLRVLADTDTLSTLPEAYIADGLAEVVKSACIKDAYLFDLLEKQPALTTDNRETVITRCMDIKRGVVERDERESGERKLLNFGHTLAHALEKHYQYKGLSHGMAVAVGMAEITRASERQGLTKPGTTERLCRLLSALSLPVSDPAPLAAYLSGALLDKKRDGAALDLILLHDIGNAYIQRVSVNDLPAFFGLEC